MKQTRLLTLMFLVLIFSAFTLAQSQGSAAPSQPTTRPVVQKVNVVRGDDGVRVEVTANGRLSPTVTEMSSPDRLVLDLPNTAVGRPQEIPVNGDGVKSVRVAQNSPVLSRVVVDLLEPRQYELIPHGKQLTLHVRAGQPAAATANAHVPVQADNAAQEATSTAAHDYVFVE